MEQARKGAELHNIKQCEKCLRYLDADNKPLEPQPNLRSSLRGIGVPELVSQCSGCQAKIEAGRSCLPKDD